MTAQILTPDPVPGIEKFWNQADLVVPDPLVDVLVAYLDMTGATTVDLAYRRGDRWVLTGSDPDIFINPFYWMPLPPAPESLENLTC